MVWTGGGGFRVFSSGVLTTNLEEDVGRLFEGGLGQKVWALGNESVDLSRLVPSVATVNVQCLNESIIAS